MKSLTNCVTGLICLGITLLLTACGGGGGSSTPATSKSTVSTSASIAVSSSSNSSTQMSSSSIAPLGKCTIDGMQWNVCTNDNGGWGFENNQYCVSQKFCPANRTTLSAVAMRSTPVDANANAKTQAIYTYLKSIWGQKTLSGQQDLTWKDSVDMAERVHTDTGRYPAIMGYDFMNYGMTAAWTEGIKQTQEAIEYTKKGGLVTFAWHWRDPALLNTSGVNEAQFYTKDTSFQIPVKDGVLDTGSAAYTQINVGIDLIAVELSVLNNAGVSVLWRPLHEASGNNGDGWFWWGRTRTDGVPQSFAQILLWRHIYDRLTNHHGLHNLLWVWNGQNAAWYPGDEYVDIVSHDIYDSSDNKTYKSQISTYTQARKYPFENKMVALSENSYIPDPDKIATDGAWWMWFMVWNDGHTDEGAGVTHKDNFWTGEYYNTNIHKTKVYGHDNVVTLDELPSF